MKIASVVGARPNIIKLAPIHKAIRTFSDHHRHVIIHTGQHYDYKLSEIFFKEFDLPKPDFDLNVGSATPGFQIGEMIKRLEKIFLKYNDFNLVLVYGDTNSTFAGALAAMKSGIRVAHVEAGLRSFDRRMPEEINRILTDQLSDYLFTTERIANQNLLREGIPSERVFFVGNVMIDTLLKHRETALKSDILARLEVSDRNYAVCTLHRPSNVDT